MEVSSLWSDPGFAGEEERTKPRGSGGAILDTRRSNGDHPGFKIGRDDGQDYVPGVFCSRLHRPYTREGGPDNLIWRTAVAWIKNPRFHEHPGRISLQETVDRKRRSLQERQRINWRRPGHITTQKRDLLHRLSRQRVDRHAIDCVGDPEKSQG